MDRDVFSLKFPLERTHCGLVMGNGNFGAMVWGIDRLHVTVNRADFWDHRGGELIVPGTTYRKLVEVSRTQGCGEALANAIPRETFPPDVFKPQRLPVGRFEFCFADGTVPQRIDLEYATGTATVLLSDGRHISLDLSLRDSVLLLRDPSRAMQSVRAMPSWEFPDAREWLQRCGFRAPDAVDGGWAQSCPADPSLACLCRRHADGYAIGLEHGADNAEALRHAERRIAGLDAQALLDGNRRWWGAYWADAPAIELPDEGFNVFFKYALYRFGAATHPDGCACALQGPWQEEYKRAEWSGDYHFNVNVQQIYSLAFAAGKPEHLHPLFDMIESAPFQEALHHNARVMFGIEDGLWFTHAVDDRGRQCGWLIPGAILDPACGAWTAQLYWDYHRHTGDIDFLRNRAYPFMRGIMRGYEMMLEEHEGRLSIPLAISAEYGCSNPAAGEGGRDPSYQLAAAHRLADILVEAAGILGCAPEPIWLEIRERLPPFSTVSSADGSERRIAIWEGQDLDVCHRHHSHLACIYPFQTLIDPTPEQAAVIDNTIDQWILMGMGQWSEWCMPWAAIIQSRLGFTEAPMILFRMWREIFVNEGLATVYLPRSRGIIAHRRQDMKKPRESSEFIQLDGTFGAATALLEMLAHVAGDAVRLFRGIPEQWRDVSFRNIHLPGGFTIGATRGREVHVLSRFGGTLKLEVDGRRLEIPLKAGEARTLALR